MTSESSVRSVSRTFDLLDLFDHRRPFLSLRDVVERSGLPKTTALRLLGSLQERALVVTRPDGTYTLGAAALRWVRLSQSLWDVDESTRAVMRRLVDALGETTNVYVRQDVVRTSIAQEEGTNTVRNVVEVGRPMPLWGGSAAKVLLAAAPDDLYDVLLEQRPDLDVAGYRAEVAQARDAGYAVSVGEREVGASSVSAPITNREGRVIAALSVSGPSPRLAGDRLAAAVEAVTEAARTIQAHGLGSVEELL